MITTVFGAWYSERTGFVCNGTEADFQSAGIQIGELLAQLGHKLVVTSVSPHTIDGYVAEGYLTWMKRQGGKPIDSVRPITFIKFEPIQRDGPDEESERRFAEISRKFPNAATYEWAQGYFRFNRHLATLKRVDCVLAVGGADHTFMAGEVALLSGKPLIPVGSFGGAAEKLIKNMMDRSDLAGRHALGQLAGPWSEGVMDALRSLLSTLRISVIHGHGLDWMAVRDCINSTSNSSIIFSPVVMKETVRGAEALPHKWESMAGRSHAAIAVITPDDHGGPLNTSTPLPRARQNVWLEVGWVWGRLGRQRLMLLLRDDVEIPSDLLGIEYHRYTASPTERIKEIQSFLLALS